MERDGEAVGLVTQALQDSEAFYQSLVDSLPLNLFHKDREGRVTFGNRRYCSTLKMPLNRTPTT